MNNKLNFKKHLLKFKQLLESLVDGVVMADIEDGIDVDIIDVGIVIDAGEDGKITIEGTGVIIVDTIEIIIIVMMSGMD